MEFLDAMKKAMLAGLGVPDKLKEVVDDLIKRGELSETQGSKLLQELSDKADKGTADISKAVAEAASKTLQKMNIPTIEQHTALAEEVKALQARVKKLEGDS